ncbi:MAG: pantetheine-phosphate adenylyltransferase [Alphaproteobacteria bacterium]|nr:pantetheine-phosphate adenylyltransferase [Alphaproteobacteria bacterium]
MSVIAVYPGTFDPFTYGHCDVACRAAKLVDKLIIAVSVHMKKNTLFSADERIALTQDALAEYNAELAQKMVVLKFDNLLVDFMKQHQCDTIFRGLRATTDFEYEFQMASINRQLKADIDTVFLPADDKFHFVSSSMVREIASLAGDVSQFVTPVVKRAITKKFAHLNI